MSDYLLINIAIIFVPLLLSFDKNLEFYKKTLSVLISIIVVSSIYIVWDSFATFRNDWSFNPNYLTGLNFFHLPIEEILFFITVPYSCIFIYETLSFYLKEKQFNINKKFFYAVAVLLLLTASLFAGQNYTFTVLIFCSAFFAIGAYYFSKLLNSKIFWLTILTTYVPFLIVNYLLTSIPIVEYNSNAILGIRFLTIPVEDFFYSFSMIAFWILVYYLSSEYRVLVLSNKKVSGEI